MEDGDGEETTVLGPAPLVRNVADNQLCLQPEGLEVLRRARAPVHIVFAIGGSRCGKSTASNALAFGADRLEESGFTTGDSFDPVTEGVDVAARLLPDGGSLVVADCEGAFHACGSAQSARGFGSLGLLAYRMATSLLHVSMGSIDERDIEAIGFLAAHGCSSPEFREGAESEDGTSEMPMLPSMPPGSAPSLFLLVNGARFNLGDAVAKKLLRVPDEGLEAGRNCARLAIARGFRSSPALEAFPACDHAAYWPKVNALRRRILEAAPSKLDSGHLAAGPDLVDRLSGLVAGLNGEAPSAVLAREPQAATEALYKSMHLEPLVEELSRRFAASGAAAEERVATACNGEAPISPAKCALDEMLVEFDRRTAWLSGKDEIERGTPSPPLLRLEVLAEVRARLAARLNGTREALARGRKQGAQSRPARKGGRPSSLSGTPPSMGAEKENISPTNPGTPSAKNLAALESSLGEVESQLQHFLSMSEQELGELRAAFEITREEIVQSGRSYKESERQAAADVQTLQESFQASLRGLAEARLRLSGAQATNSGAIVAELQGELLAIGEGLPDAAGLCSTQIAEVRNAIEAHRLRRQEAGNETAHEVEVHLKALREEISSEATAVASFKDAASQQFVHGIKELQTELKEEATQRKSRYVALTEVVHRMQTSLEVSAEEYGLTPPRLMRTPRTPVSSTPAVGTPAAPATLPGSEVARAARTGLWGTVSGTTTPSASRSSTPRRTALPAPPLMHGREW